ncbi:MAG: 2-oxoacid:acceptor oxidoreductase subunit alpha [Thermoplasmatota archaeon]
MTRKEVSIRIGGAAGDGVASTGEMFARTMSRSGLHVYAYNSYQSVIRGGHVWFQIRAGSEKVKYVGQDFDILIALNTQTVDAHLPHLRPGGALIYDPAKVKVDPKSLPEGVKDCPMPLLKIAAEFSKNPILANAVALGATMQFIGASMDTFKGVIADQFGHKKQDVIDSNVNAASKGAEYAAQWGKIDVALGYDATKKRLLLTGNQAVALGALAAGCKFYSFYPMTPASSVGHYLAEHGPKLGTVVKQAEDELAVINMAIGAGFAGVRSMCGTSGGGFALMTEAMGLAGMTETPLVVIESQRSGPSTGLPTKTEQGDLWQMLSAGQGDYPRALLAPRNVEEAFYETAKAFNLAEKWQMPVLVAVDLLLSEHYETVDSFDFAVAIERGLWHASGEFKRYALTPSGASPRSRPGIKGTEFIAGSDEHDEKGLLVSDVRAGLPEAIVHRNQQMEKRMRKLDGAVKELRGPEWWGVADAPVTLVSWGSTQGAVREAIETLAAEGVVANSLEFSDLFPFPSGPALVALKKAKFTIIVEGNFTGQFERLVRAETGWSPDERLHKYDGEPFWPEDIAEFVKKTVKSANLVEAHAKGGR